MRRAVLSDQWHWVAHPVGEAPHDQAVLGEGGVLAGDADLGSPVVEQREDRPPRHRRRPVRVAPRLVIPIDRPM